MIWLFIFAVWLVAFLWSGWRLAYALGRRDAFRETLASLDAALRIGDTE